MVMSGAVLKKIALKSGAVKRADVDDYYSLWDKIISCNGWMYNNAERNYVSGYVDS